MKFCLVESCVKEARSEGFCWKHHNRKERYGDPLGGPAYYANLPDDERFMKYVDKIEVTGCWHWKGALNQEYGKFRIGKKQMGAHRAAMMMFAECPPNFSELLVCHKCDNPKCVNPDHLFLGTQQANIDDKMRKGRHSTGRGIDYPQAKLNEEKVLFIRGSELDSAALAEKFGVCAANINSIRSGKRWKHVGGTLVMHEIHRKGADHPMAKMTAEKVRHIRTSSARNAEMAREFGITQQSVCDIRKGRTWKHVLDEGETDGSIKPKPD